MSSQPPADDNLPSLKPAAVTIERASVRAPEVEDEELLTHLTLASSTEQAKIPQKGTTINIQAISSPPITKMEAVEHDRSRESQSPRRRRPRSNSKNSGRHEHQFPHQSRFPNLKWAPPKNKLAVPVLADNSDEESDDEDHHGNQRTIGAAPRKRSRSHSKPIISAPNVIDMQGENIMQYEIDKPKNRDAESTHYDNNRQRRERRRARRRRSQHNVHESSDDEEHGNDVETVSDAKTADGADNENEIPESTSKRGREHSPILAHERPNQQNQQQPHRSPQPHQQQPEQQQSPPPSQGHYPPDQPPSSQVSHDHRRDQHDTKHSTPLYKKKDKFPESTAYHHQKPSEKVQQKASSSQPLTTTISRTGDQVDANPDDTDNALLQVPSLSPISKPLRKTLDEQVREDDMLQKQTAKGWHEDTGDIEKSRSYIEDSKVSMEEDSEHEFKAVQNSSQPLERIVAYCKKYIVSFLNASGGVMYFGVEDDGRVKGVPFSRRGRDLLRLAIDMTVSHIRPQVDPHLVQIILVPVEADPSVSGRRKKQDHKALQDSDFLSRFVIEVHIGKGDAPVYMTQDGCAYFRRSGSVYKMDTELIQRRMEHGRPMFQGDVPEVPKDFIGREKELAQIREYVVQRQNERYILILLHGLPMTGKSTLAHQLVSVWASMWPDQHFLADLKGYTRHYIDTTEAKVSVIRSVYPILQLPSSKAEVNGIYQSCFKKKRCILLLENVGKVAQIEELLSQAASFAKSLLVIVTSRIDLPIEVVFEGLSVRLSALEETSGIQLLRSVKRARGPILSDAQALQLVKLCGCMPLPIRMLAALIARMPDISSVNSLIHTIQVDDSKRLEILFGQLASPWDIHPTAFPTEAPELSITPSEAEALQQARPPQEFLLSLSIFPATFDLIAVSNLWGLPIKESATILQSLVDSNEIELSQDKLRYSQNDLFRAWCQKKALEVFGEDGLSKWKLLFIDYYLSVMRKCIDFYSKHQVKQGLELLSLESANFEATITYSLQVDNPLICAEILFTLNNFNAFFGSGEQRKWDKLKVPLLNNPTIVELASRLSQGKIEHPAPISHDTAPSLSIPDKLTPKEPKLPLITESPASAPSVVVVPASPSSEANSSSIASTAAPVPSTGALSAAPANAQPAVIPAVVPSSNTASNPTPAKPLSSTQIDPDFYG